MVNIFPWKIFERMKLVLISHPKGKVPLGETCEYRIKRHKPRTEFRAYINHHGISYLNPLNQWTMDNIIHFFPEAPGEYTLSVKWRNQDGKQGWIEDSFEVVTNRFYSCSPQLVHIDEGTKIWAPSEWESKQLIDYEKSAYEMLTQIVKPGWVVYDIGASIGLYSLLFSHLIGKHGYIYCVEANPLCIYFLHANLEMNNVANFNILPAVLLDTAKAAKFTINYSNLNLGITQDSVFYSEKAGHQITLQSYSLDDLISNLHLRKPDLIKIDVEGAEEYVIKGMKKILLDFHPTLLLEIHGRTAAENTFKHLDNKHYHYKHPSSNQVFTNKNNLLAWFPNSVEQIICIPI